MMLSRTSCLLVSRNSRLLLNSLKDGQTLVLPRRNIRAVRRIFRQKLPQYKTDLGDLPPLTQLLTLKDESASDPDSSQLLKSLNELRTKKLETYKCYLPVNQKPVLLEALLSTDNDIDRLLRIIDENLETMTSFYIAVSFETLDDMMRYRQCDIGTVIVSPELKRLCKRALYKMRFFEADEILKLVKFISIIELPEESLLSQSAFQMARHLINDFNLDELETLSECLEKFKISDTSKKSLLLALKDAIPVVKVNQVEEKLLTQIDNTKSMTTLKKQN